MSELTDFYGKVITTNPVLTTWGEHSQLLPDGSPFNCRLTRSYASQADFVTINDKEHIMFYNRVRYLTEGGKMEISDEPQRIIFQRPSLAIEAASRVREMMKTLEQFKGLHIKDIYYHHVFSVNSSTPPLFVMLSIHLNNKQYEDYIRFIPSFYYKEEEPRPKIGMDSKGKLTGTGQSIYPTFRAYFRGKRSAGVEIPVSGDIQFGDLTFSNSEEMFEGVLEHSSSNNGRIEVKHGRRSNVLIPKISSSNAGPVVKALYSMCKRAAHLRGERFLLDQPIIEKYEEAREGGKKRSLYDIPNYQDLLIGKVEDVTIDELDLNNLSF